MNRRFCNAMRWGELAVACCLVAWSGQQATAQRVGDAQQGEVLTRGQLHEAFAEVINFNPQPGLAIPNVQVPPQIQERTPEGGPEGEGFLWIPGYWAWDDERTDFIWISGVWRRPPPGTQWVPGYWTDTEQGVQWVSGYWLPVEDTQTDLRVQYLPTPPESREAGPLSPRPSEDDFWDPGYWAWQDGDYHWRPGGWKRGAVGQVWIPAHFAWTPRGCVFLASHWDHTMTDRGVPFSPVYFSRAVYSQPGFSYVPWVVLDTGLLDSYLFSRPRYGHFYFGDYYNPRYERLGIVPWFALHQSRFAYNPAYVYGHWYNSRRNPQWAAQVRSRYQYRVENEFARPPRTFAAMQELARQADGEEVQDVLLAESLDRAIEQRRFPLPLEQMKTQRRQQQLDVAAKFQDLANKRSEIERDRPGTTSDAQEAELPLGDVRQAIRQATDIPTSQETPTLEERPRDERPKAIAPLQLSPLETPKPETPKPAEIPEISKPEISQPAVKPESPEEQKAGSPQRPERAEEQPEQRPEKERPRGERPKAIAPLQPSPLEIPKPETSKPETPKPAERPEPREKLREDMPRRGAEGPQQPKVIEPSERPQQRGRPSPGDQTPSRKTPSRTARPEAGNLQQMPERTRRSSPQRPETIGPDRPARTPSRLGRPTDRPTQPNSFGTPQRGRMQQPEMRRQEPAGTTPSADIPRRTSTRETRSKSSADTPTRKERPSRSSREK